MQTLNVSLIVTRDSEILSSTHVHDDVSFDDPLVAFEYERSYKMWLSQRPRAEDPGSWRPRVIEKLVPVDFATFQAAELGRIITPRDGSLGWADDDPEAIASAAEHRPYDCESSEAA